MTTKTARLVFHFDDEHAELSCDNNYWNLYDNDGIRNTVIYCNKLLWQNFCVKEESQHFLDDVAEFKLNFLNDKIAEFKGIVKL